MGIKIWYGFSLKILMMDDARIWREEQNWYPWEKLAARKDFRPSTVVWDFFGGHRDWLKKTHAT